MKGLLKYLSPFAPDQSGAASVFYDMHTLTVILDAGGCTGNICGFDEPRWFDHKSPIFSAGLRDMDAILGRDDRLVEKLLLAIRQVEAEAAVLIGTPVPAVIGTDLNALRKMAEKKCKLPVIAVSCTGTNLYDKGMEEAYESLFKTILSGDIEERPEKTEGKTLGILGATCMDLRGIHGDRKLREYYKEKGYTDVYCFGMGDGMEAVKAAPYLDEIVCVSPAGLKTAGYLNKRFGIPCRAEYPLIEESVKNRMKELKNKKVLILHQQVEANELRSLIRQEKEDADVTVATFFFLKKEISEEGDLHLETEEAYRSLVKDGGYDVIIGDPLLKRAVPFYEGEWIDRPHTAVSGTLFD